MVTILWLIGLRPKYRKENKGNSIFHVSTFNKNRAQTYPQKGHCLTQFEMSFVEPVGCTRENDICPRSLPFLAKNEKMNMMNSEKQGFQAFLKAHGYTQRDWESGRPKIRARVKDSFKRNSGGSSSSANSRLAKTAGSWMHYHLTDVQCPEWNELVSFQFLRTRVCTSPKEKRKSQLL